MSEICFVTNSVNISAIIPHSNRRPSRTSLGIFLFLTLLPGLKCTLEYNVAAGGRNPPRLIRGLMAQLQRQSRPGNTCYTRLEQRPNESAGRLIIQMEMA